MFGNSKADKAAEKQAQQEAKDKAAIEKFGLDFDNYSSDDIKIKNIALAAWDIDKGVFDTEEYFIKSEYYSISRAATKINNLTCESIALKPQYFAPSSVIKKVDLFCSRNFDRERPIVLAGHNIAFDVAFLRQFYKMNGASFDNRYSHRTVDTHAILYFLYISGKTCGLNSLSSSDAFSHFNIAVKDRHSALGDVIATAELFGEMLKIVTTPREECLY